MTTSATHRPGLRLTRRSVIGGAVALGAARAVAGAAPATAEAPRVARQRHVAVIGAGAFGGWTALALRRRGLEVTLLDAWGAGNPRASSGGETRVIRGVYGPDALYTDWVVRSFAAWRRADAEWDAGLYHPTGALWLFRGDDGYVRSSLPALQGAGLEAVALSAEEVAARWPAIHLAGVRSCWFEPEAGYLLARRACREVARAVAGEGGTYRLARAVPGEIEGSRMAAVRLDDGSTLAADAFVFACGPWLGQVLPEVVGARIRPTRQEVFYFGPPAGGGWGEGQLPVWIDFGERVFYGIPGNQGRGFKVADDTHGEPVDPTTLERVPSAAALARARALVAERFPALATAPLVESRVCQYENSADGHYLIDRHPGAANVWLVGGGSGHGFKLGPAVGEHVADLVTEAAEPLERFALARLPADGGPTRSQLSGREER